MDIILCSEVLLIEGVVAFSWKEIIAPTGLVTSHAKTATHRTENKIYATVFYVNTS
jgi:hypothetical protein